MNLDPFSKNAMDPFRNQGISKSKDDLFVKNKTGGLGRRAPPAEALEPMDIPQAEAAPEPEKKKATVKLNNPKWEADKVGFNEETSISVDLDLPEEHAHKTKVTFELFAKTPKGPERISQGEGVAKGGKAFCKIPIYIPGFKDEDGNRLEKVEYFFLAKHSEAEPLDASKAPKLVDEMADRLIESHVLPDITFGTGSSFLHPKQAAALKDLVSRIQGWRKKTPDGKLAIFGHADAAGKEEANKTLSERRAQSLLAFLLKDTDVWEDLYSKDKWGLTASQEYLKHLGHDPGTVDGQDGPKTKEAVKAFQAKLGSAQSGSVDAATRKALFKAFIDKYNGLDLKEKDFDDINGNPSAGCSEFNLAEKNTGPCEANRRVAIFLLKSNKNFPITYPCAKGDIGTCRKQVARKGDRRTAGFGCFFYDKLIVERPNQKIDAQKSIRAFLHSSEPELKQFVNVSGGKNEGLEFHMEVKVEGNAGKVYWKAVAGKANSKRNDPAPGWIDPKSKKSIALSKGIGEYESEVVEGKAKAVFCLGLAGGDEFTFEVGSERGTKELEQKIVNWRRLWYQLNHHKDISPPSMDTALDKLKTAFVEWVAEPAVTHSKAPAGKVIVGSHNAGEYHKLLNSKHAGQCAHIIFCDKQYDGIDTNGNNFISENRETFTYPVEAIRMSSPDDNLEILNPPIQKGAKLLLSASWKNKVTGKSGKLTDNPKKTDDDTGLAIWHDTDYFEVSLPKNATPSDKTPVVVVMRATAAYGPWGGDGGTSPHNLIVIDSDDTINTHCVLHELGHIINMVPKASIYKAPPGFSLADHTNSYVKMGGEGSHCSWEIDTSASSATENVNGKCIMFHRLNPECKLVYCPECLPLVKAQSLMKFQDLEG